MSKITTISKFIIMSKIFTTITVTTSNAVIAIGVSTTSSNMSAVSINQQKRSTSVLFIKARNILFGAAVCIRDCQLRSA